MTRTQRIQTFIDGYYSAWFCCADRPTAAANEHLADHGEQPLTDDERFEALVKVDKLIDGSR